MFTNDVQGILQNLLQQVAASQTPREVLKASEFKQMYGAIASLLLKSVVLLVVK
jgi:hypothetical protein